MSKVSIIIPLYNKAPYINKALDSVCAQTYTDWECIVVNDGSTDNSLLIVNDFCRKHQELNIKVISQENSGVSAARNKGISESKGEFIAFLDSDDWWSPRFLEVMMHFATIYPNASVFACNYYKVKCGGLNSFFDLPSGPANYFQMYQSIAMPITSISVLVKRTLLDDVAVVNDKGVVEYFKTKLKFGEDFDLWIRLCMNSQFVWCNEHLAYYNNDVPVQSRAVGNLHNPESHILWNLDCYVDMENSNPDFKKVIDFQRVYGLYRYYLSKEYQLLAVEQLKKVDWNQQSVIYKLKYHTPIYMLRVINQIRVYGSSIKRWMFLNLK